MKKLHISRCQCRKPASRKQPNSPLPRRGRAGTGFARILCAAIRQRTAKSALAFLLLTALSAHAITLELALDGQIHGVPVDNLQLRAESNDYQHWRVSGQLPATRLAGSPLKTPSLTRNCAATATTSPRNPRPRSHAAKPRCTSTPTASSCKTCCTASFSSRPARSCACKRANTPCKPP